MKTITAELTDMVMAQLQDLGIDGVLKKVEEVQICKNPKFGDFQSNHAFQIGKIQRTNPRQVAESVKEAFGEQPAFSEISVAGPGFLNFRLSNEWLVAKLQAMTNDEHRGIPQVSDKTVVVDFSSPNVAKRMHIGHMRSTIIGHTIDQMYRAAGWKVIADNHIGDWGTQFGKLMVSWREDMNPEDFAADPIGELERLYVRFGQLETPERLELAKQETVKLQQGDEENRRLWKHFIDVSLKEFNSVYDRLGIAFDVVLGESFYNDALPDVVSSLQEHGISTDSDGAVIVAFEKGSKPKMLSETALVIQKQDGAYLYGTTDLATCEYRLHTWNPDEVVYVTDMRQQLHFQQVFKTWQDWRLKRGATEEDLQSPELTHVWFGMLKLPEGAMSTRAGNVIRLVDLLDEAVQRARAVVDEKSSFLPEEQRAAIAEAVGVSSIRYADLSQNPQTDVTFEWDKLLSLDGNTAPFLMYSYARAKSILRKGGVENPTVADLQILDDVERDLALLMLQFPIQVQAAMSSHRPNILCEYLYALASSFNRFYFSNPVLTASDDSVKKSRLSMVEAMLRVMEKGFSILGIRALDRM